MAAAAERPKSAGRKTIIKEIAPDPGRPWPMNAAEEVAIASMNKILNDAGQQLWRKYLTRKSFIFAKDSAAEVAISRMLMCCPSHDSMDTHNDWMIEEEPNPEPPDCWARHILRKPDEETPTPCEPPPCDDHSSSAGSTAGLLENQGDADVAVLRRTQSTPSITDAAARRRTVISSNSETSSQTSRSGSKSNLKVPVSLLSVKKMKDNRAFALPDFFVVDEQEDKLRLAKARQEAMRARQEEEERRIQAEEEEEERRKERKRRADELDPRQFTFATDGKMLLVQEPDPEELPEVLAHLEHEVEVTANDSLPFYDYVPKKKSPPISPRPKRKAQRRRKEKPKQEEQEVYTDGFYKPEYMQPPLMDTMNVRPGVVLEFGSQRKSGPVSKTEKRQMSRREYFWIVEGRAQLNGSRPSSASGPRESSASEAQKKSAAEAAKRPGSAPSGKRANAPAPLNLSRQGQEGQAPAEGQALEAEASKDRSSSGKHSSTRQSSRSEPAATRVGRGLRAAKPIIIGPPGENNHKAPPAPAWSVRLNSRALAKDTRPPRYHVAALGAGPNGSGRVQPPPPLGATMGHGLMKESYYQPQGSSEPPLIESQQLARASSAPAVSRKR